ncbi:helix-turn-helix transcriptional regulator [Actinoallomurus sp. NPDC052274]
MQRRRRQRGMSQAELARRTGLSKATLSQLESGGGSPASTPSTPSPSR